MSQTSAQLLSDVEDAIARIVNGAQFITVNGQQFQYTQLSELRRWRKELKIEVAEAAGTDGRGAWEGVFNG